MCPTMSWPDEDTPADRPHPVPWMTSDVIMGTALAMIAIVVAILVYSFITWALDADLGTGIDVLILGTITPVVLLMVSWTMGPGKYRASSATLVLSRRRSWRYLHLLLPLLVLVGSLVFTGIYAGVLSLLGLDDLSPGPVPDDVILGGPAVIGSFMIIVLWGPFSEEVFFRGFIFSGLSGRLGFVGAAVVSAAMFAVLHDPKAMVPIFATGILLAWLYYKTGSLWGSITAHALQNAIAFSIST